MKEKMIGFLKKLSRGPLAPLFRLAWDAVVWVQMIWLRVQWWLSGAKKPAPEQQAQMREKVTFVYKSFERQSMARRLYRNIQRYYPGVRVVIADDSKVPLELSGPGLTVVHLPFNSGLSKGLNAALAQVQTPYVVRMDDDELLTPFSNFHGQLEFLMAHPEVDLVGVMPRNLPLEGKWKQEAKKYYAEAMGHAFKPLKIPHGTWIDCDHVVLGKVPNIFLVRTEAYRSVGYDDNIRMIDHQDFFFRAAGNLVSVLDESSFVLHYHNRLNRYYQRFREDVEGDRRYIRWKYSVMLHEMQKRVEE